MDILLVGCNIRCLSMQAEISIGFIARFVAIAKAIATVIFLQPCERCQLGLFGFKAHHIMAIH